MSLPADYHMHTPLCRHATGEPTELAAQAVRLGLKEIGFSDHSPMPRDDFDDWRMQAADLDEYVARVEQARRDHPNLVIKLALEVDYLPGYEDWIRDLAARHPWDYFIGSVHYVSDSWAIDNPAEISRVEEARADGGLDRLLRAPDPGGRVRPLRHHRPRRPVQEVRHLSPGRIARPCSRVSCKPPNAAAWPSSSTPPASARSARRSIPARASSTWPRNSACRSPSAPTPTPRTEVGLNFAEAVQLAHSAGYTHYCRFTKRQREEVAL